MEKILIGIEMATRWTDPTMVLVVGLVGWIVAHVGLLLASMAYYNPLFLLVPVVLEYLYWNYVYHATEPADTEKFLEFHDDALKRLYSHAKMPISTFYEEFMAGRVGIKGDMWETLDEHRYEFLNFKVTFKMCKWLIFQTLPKGIAGEGFGTGNSSFKDKASTKKEIAEHYDRGNDFFFSFLGPAMVYTSGVFKGLHQSLETAQKNKMSLICDKLQLKEGEKFLDIGCGWGTLARHAASYYGASSVGVTLSVEGAKWCNEQNRMEDLDDSVEIRCQDYRDIDEKKKFDKISSIEMAEHVGIANFQIYLNKISNILSDDGMFLMQVAGLRQGSDWEDVAWGLFMSKYIFPGADASTPLNWYVKQLELAGFEVHSVETIGRHYSHTLHRWYDNWMSNREEMTDKYGSHLFRLWEFFLAWSTVAAGQGSATCYQILVHKNLKKFPRDVWCTEDGVSAGHVPQGDEWASTSVGVGVGTTSKARRR